jgi:hypothetical protein
MPIKSADTEAAVSGSGGGKAEAAKYGMCEFYFISTASTIYTTLVLIVKE